MAVERDDAHAYSLIRILVKERLPDDVSEILDAIADVIKSTGRNDQ